MINMPLPSKHLKDLHSTGIAKMAIYTVTFVASYDF